VSVVQRRVGVDGPTFAHLSLFSRLIMIHMVSHCAMYSGSRLNVVEQYSLCRHTFNVKVSA
jgi:hypothetical protein